MRRRVVILQQKNLIGRVTKFPSPTTLKQTSEGEKHMSINLSLRPAALIRVKLYLLTAVLTLLPVIGWSQEYSVIDLGTLGGSTSTAYAVNNNGQVVGSANIQGDSHADPFTYSSGAMTDLFSSGSPYGGVAVALNNLGHIAINYALDPSGDTEALFYDGAGLIGITDLGPAAGINDSDTVVGANQNDYWLFSEGQLNTNPPSLPMPGYPPTLTILPQAINNSGQVSAICIAGTDPFPTGCILSSSATVAPPTAFETENMPINSLGATCGDDPDTGTGFSGAAFWASDGTLTNLWAANGYMYSCLGLDDYGNGVGYVDVYKPNSDVFVESYPTIYDPVNGPRNLNTLVPHPHIIYHGHFPPEVVSAVAISDTGYIAANCLINRVYGPSEAHACLLTPLAGAIMGNSIQELERKNPHCEICKRDLVPEAKSLPKSLERLSTEEKKRVQKTVEEIDEHVRAAFDDKQISGPQAELLLHQSEMVLKAAGVALP
jgi:probable HAF family extracellular repeat protein